MLSESARDLLIQNVDVDGRRVDVKIRDDVIVTVEDPGKSARAETVINGSGGALIPGLHDHHIHLAALAAAETSLLFDAGFVVRLQQAHATLPPGQWIRCVGYHESIIGELNRTRLDHIVADRPVRVQHRTGAMWVVNSCGLQELGVASGNGQLFGAEALMRALAGGGEADILATARDLARFGVTGVTDLTPIDAEDDLERLAAAGRDAEFPLELTVTGGPALATTEPLGVGRGPVKIVVADHALPSVESLCSEISRARVAKRAVAVHCVTRVALVLTLAALEEAGTMPGDRIEHGAVIPLDVLPWIRHLALTIVTQPSFVFDRGDQYLVDVEESDRDDLWRCGSLLASGIPVGGSTDAPFGDPDPWHAVTNATVRETRLGKPIGNAERISAGQALDMFLTSVHSPGGPPRRIAPGAVAHLCLLHVPLTEALRHPTSEHVAATITRNHVWRHR